MKAKKSDLGIRGRQFLNVWAVITGCMILVSTTYAMSNPVKNPSSKPNILFIFSDDHSTNTISAYGSKINKTPHIDRIANEGAVFLNSFCTNSICQPSRATILTGKHSHLNGVTYNGARWNKEQTIFPPLLQKAGYQTVLIGKWHMHPDPSDEFGYWKVLTGSGGQGRYYNPIFNSAQGTETITGYSTDVITDQAIDWMDHQRDPDKPFMLMVQFKSPHVPRRPAVRHLELFKDADIPEPETLHDDYKTRQPYAGDAWMHISGLNEEVLNIFPPKDSDIPPDDKQKEFLSRLSPEDREKYHQAYDAENAEYYRMKQSGELNDRKTATKYYYQRFIKNYLRCVAAVDENVGRLLEYLDRNKLAENTVVVYSSDQSYFIGEHGWAEKRWMYEEALEMPFVIRWPEKIKPGQNIYELIQNMDYAPTFLEMAGLSIPEDMQGSSLLPLMTKKRNKTPWRDVIYYHYYQHGAHNVPRHDGVRTQRYKLIHFYTDDSYEMYDLKEDPHEINNFYDTLRGKEVQQDMLKRLHQLRKEYKVPESVFKPPYEHEAKP